LHLSKASPIGGHKPIVLIGDILVRIPPWKRVLQSLVFL
jgi:hypothetical protein